MKTALPPLLARPDFYTGLLTMMVGAGGLLDIAYGNWRAGPGLGPHAFPQLAYITLLLSGGAIWLDALRGKTDGILSDQRAVLITGVMLVAAGVGMFWMIGKLGLGVTVLVSLIGASSVLTRHPLKHWRSTILVPVLATATIWALFVWIVKIPLSAGLLF